MLCVSQRRRQRGGPLSSAGQAVREGKNFSSNTVGWTAEEGTRFVVIAADIDTDPLPIITQEASFEELCKEVSYYLLVHGGEQFM